jgi:hypothetical protein
MLYCYNSILGSSVGKDPKEAVFSFHPWAPTQAYPALPSLAVQSVREGFGRWVFGGNSKSGWEGSQTHHAQLRLYVCGGPLFRRSKPGLSLCFAFSEITWRSPRAERDTERLVLAGVRAADDALILKMPAEVRGASQSKETMPDSWPSGAGTPAPSRGFLSCLLADSACGGAPWDDSRPGRFGC